jgi:hypothetical protein
VHPQSGAAALGAIAPRLVGSIPMSAQLEHAGEQFDAAAMAAVAGLISSEAGGFARLTRRLLYGMLGLGQPATRARLLEAPAPPSLRTLARGGVPDDRGRPSRRGRSGSTPRAGAR